MTTTDYTASAWAPDDYDAQARAAEAADDYTPEELLAMETTAAVTLDGEPIRYRPYFWVTRKYGVRAEYGDMRSAIAGPFADHEAAIAERDRLWAIR